MGQKRNSKNELTNFAFPKENREAISQCINKIMNTLSFRKLAGKTQVILSLAGPDIRTRLTHTIEVAKIARDICKDLGLNENLAEAIALSHDIGHTPFGHVGERTLREIMCGCNSLGGKVEGYDFGNSGYKHNLQSFRVLYDFEKITKEHRKIWPYILWGAIAHTKLSWATPESGLEDEILISSKHCVRVYACDYDKKKECKRNIQQKKNLEFRENNEICKPWFCAHLDVVKTDKEVKPNNLKPGETKRDYINKEYIKEDYQNKIYCSRKCYLAKLWKYRIEKNNVSIEHPYLFDHPFPNSFYSKSLNSYFFKTYSNKKGKEYFSIEAIVVRQADEIAQRQQDLEDGINKGLLSFDEAKDQVKIMIEPFRNEDNIDKIYKRVEDAMKSHELGKLLVMFYRKLIYIGTIKNFSKFEGHFQNEMINIYSLLNILNSIRDGYSIKSNWIKKELKDIRHGGFPENNNEHSFLCKYFEINYSRAYLYCLTYSHLEGCLKQRDYSKDNIDILDDCIKCLELDINDSNAKDEHLKKKAQQSLNKLKKGLEILKESYKKPDIFETAYFFFRALDQLSHYLKYFFEEEFEDFFKASKKKWWKNIGALNLHHFFILSSICKSNNMKKNESLCLKDLKNFQFDIDVKKYNPKDELKNWKIILKREANRVISNLVKFIPEDDLHWKKKADALKEFEKKQKNTILKSEAVEKNDGKASYILTRLFKAYITNPHQLPDTGLTYIIITLQDEDIREKLIKSEDVTFKYILKSLKKTMVGGNEKAAKIKEIENTNFIKIAPQSEDDEFKRLKNGTSNEIKAALDNKRNLYKFFQEIEKENHKIKESLNSEQDLHRKQLKAHLRNFRAIIDNPILTPTPFWKSILTRGICDFISSLTDQEAINEYGKLYEGMMELV